MTATLVHDGAAWIELSELPLSSRIDRGYRRLEHGGIDEWLPPRGPRHMSDDGREQLGADGIGGFIPMPDAETERALAHDDDFMLCGGAIIEVVDGEAVAMDKGRLERMRRRLTTLRAHQIQPDFDQRG